MTQAEFGTATGVSANTQVRYEKGHRHPDTEYLRAVANRFSVDFNWLIGGDSAIPIVPDAEFLEQWSKMVGIKRDDLDFLLGWLQSGGDGGLTRLSSMEQTILNSYRASDHKGKRAIEAVSDAVKKDDLMRAVPADARGTKEFIEGLQAALSKSKK